MRTGGIEPSALFYKHSAITITKEGRRNQQNWGAACQTIHHATEKKIHREKRGTSSLNLKI